jgi:hypothetical protein
VFSLKLLTNSYLGNTTEWKLQQCSVPRTFPCWLSYIMTLFQLHTSKSMERDGKNMWPVWRHNVRLDALPIWTLICRLQTYPHSSVGTVTRLRDRKSTNRRSIPGRAKILSLPRNVQTGSEAHPAYSATIGSAARIIKLTTHLHLTPRLKMRRATPPLPHTPSWLT